MMVPKWTPRSGGIRAGRSGPPELTIALDPSTFALDSAIDARCGGEMASGQANVTIVTARGIASLGDLEAAAPRAGDPTVDGLGRALTINRYARAAQILEQEAAA